MKLKTPKLVTWVISLVLVIVGVLGVYAVIPGMGVPGIALILIGYALLALGTLVKFL